MSSSLTANSLSVNLQVLRLDSMLLWRCLYVGRGDRDTTSNVSERGQWRATFGSSSNHIIRISAFLWLPVCPSSPPSTRPERSLLHSAAQCCV